MTNKPLRVELWGHIQPDADGRGGGYGNILWPDFKPGPRGAYGSPHPCAGTPTPTTFGDPPPSDDPLGRFRALGYFASCFPEGDGIAFRPPEGKTTADIAGDIERTFGWLVKVKRP